MLSSMAAKQFCLTTSPPWSLSLRVAPQPFTLPLVSSDKYIYTHIFFKCKITRRHLFYSGEGFTCQIISRRKLIRFLWKYTRRVRSRAPDKVFNWIENRLNCFCYIHPSMMMIYIFNQIEHFPSCIFFLLLLLFIQSTSSSD